MGVFDPEGLSRLERTMIGHVESGAVPGLVWLVARGDEVRAGCAGTLDLLTGRPVTRDSIFRISSMTKPVTALAALILVEESRLRLDDPVDDLLPELADRRVLARPGGPLEETVPAVRPITVRDLLTFRLGLGMAFTGETQPSMQRAAQLDVGVGPPAPAGRPEPDEYLRRLGTLPLEHQPGERWLYHIGADVLGVLIARAAGQPFGTFLAERVFGPLGMAGTGFAVPSGSMDRFGPSYVTDPVSGERGSYDPADGQWSRPPAFPAGGDGLVSTADDVLAVAELLRAGGVRRGVRLLAEDTVAEMTTNQLTPDQLAVGGPDPTGAVGWGLGLGVQVRRTGSPRSVGGYGWDGGMGTTWSNDPAADLTAILMTNQMWTSPIPPPVAQDFLAGAYAALD